MIDKKQMNYVDNAFTSRVFKNIADNALRFGSRKELESIINEILYEFLQSDQFTLEVDAFYSNSIPAEFPSEMHVWLVWDDSDPQDPPKSLELLKLFADFFVVDNLSVSVYSLHSKASQ